MPNQQPQRYAFKGRRPGESFYVKDWRLQTHPVDGGVELSAEQLEYFKNEGYDVVKIGKFDGVLPNPSKGEHDVAWKAAMDEARAAGAWTAQAVPKPVSSSDLSRPEQVASA